MSDLASQIRDRVEDMVENILDPQAAAVAVLAVLDLCDRMSTDFEGKSSFVGRAFAEQVHKTIAPAFGIEVANQ